MRTNVTVVVGCSYPLPVAAEVDAEAVFGHVDSHEEHVLAVKGRSEDASGWVEGRPDVGDDSSEEDSGSCGGVQPWLLGDVGCEHHAFCPRS